MNGGQERGSPFCIASGNAAPAFEVEEGIFNEMTQFIEIGIVGTQFFAMFSRGNDHFHALLLRLLDDGIAVIAPVGYQMPGVDSFHQTACKRAIRCGTLRNNDSDRHTMRIHGQM